MERAACAALKKASWQCGKHARGRSVGSHRVLDGEAANRPRGKRGAVEIGCLGHWRAARIGEAEGSPGGFLDIAFFTAELAHTTRGTELAQSKGGAAHGRARDSSRGSPGSWGASRDLPVSPVKGINFATAFSPDRRVQFNKYVRRRAREAGQTPISGKRLSKAARTRAAPADKDEMRAYVKEEMAKVEARMMESMNAFKSEMRGEIHTLGISMYAKWKEEM
ncbi:hypothetical protein L7F22_043251 [Adiantum nelumboides]|nr:hypothetical protein [Adiantum nelumboides]